MKQTSLAKFLYLSIAAAIVTISLKFYAYQVTGSMGFLSDALESIVNLFAALFALIMLRSLKNLQTMAMCMGIAKQNTSPVPPRGHSS